MLKKSQHHHSANLTFCWHTSPNGAIQKAQKKKKKTKKKNKEKNSKNKRDKIFFLW